MPVHVLHSKHQLEEVLQKSSQLVVIKFGAKWCGPCKTMNPIFHAFSEKHKDILCVEVDADEMSEVLEEYNVSSLPTFLCLKKKTVLTSLKGAVQASVLESTILAQKSK